MIRIHALSAVLVFLVACGETRAPEAPAATDSPAASAENQAPVLSSARLTPREPVVGEALSLSVRVVDLDGDNVQVEVDWYRNGRVVESGSSTTLDTSSFSRGDQIYALATASDGTDDASARTETVVIANQLPAVGNVLLKPAKPSASDTLIVETEVIDRDGDAYELEFAWYVNDNELPDQKQASLAPGLVRRGDRVQVSVSAHDGYGQGNWARSQAVQVQNAAPRFTSSASAATIAGARYSYQLRAEDPDGDRSLRFSLVSGPPGLTVDLVSGLVTWEVPEGQSGKFPIELSVSDAYGGRFRQNFVVELNWQAAPANAEELP